MQKIKKDGTRGYQYVKVLLKYAASLLLLVPTLVFGQVAGEELILQVNDYSLIETNYAPVELNFATPTAGAPLQAVSNSDLYVHLSSIVPGGTHRKMSVQMTSGTVPAGTTLKCVSAECTTTNSGGELGVPVTPPSTLLAVDQDIVRQIGTSYTGTGYNDGYRITFTWTPDGSATYHQITSTTTTVTVVFTISPHDGNN